MTSQTYGWIPPQDRTPEMNQADAEALAAMPMFDIVGSYSAGEYAKLFEAYQKISGKESPGFIHQSTGSCVGAGGCNMTLTLQSVEILSGDAEEHKIPWWLFTYGEAREIAGMRGQGDGCFGSAWAKSATQKGFFAADADDSLPKFQNRSGWYYLPQNTEYKWSDGYSIAPKWNELGKDHLIKTAAKINNSQQAAQALQNGYPLTCASMFGTRGPRVQGNPQVSLAEWDGQWAHQMSVHAWWDHPTLGEIFWIQNSWGPNAHPKCPSGAPAGGFWIKASTMDRICRDEVFAFSAFDGFPARDLWWDIV